MMSNFFFVLILYTLWNFWIQNGSKLRTHNRNPGSKPLCNRRRFANPTKGVSLGGEMKPTYISVQLTTNLRRRALPQLISFGQQTLFQKAIWSEDGLGGRGVGGNPRAWRMWPSRRGWGTPDTALVLCRVSSIRQNQFKGVIAGNVLTTLLKILFFCVIYYRRLRGKYPWIHLAAAIRHTSLV